MEDLGELKSGFQNTTSEHLLAFINALRNINNPVILRRPIPSLILEKGTALGEQVIDFNILQSLIWRMI